MTSNSRSNKATTARNKAQEDRLAGKAHRFQQRPSNRRNKIRIFGTSVKPADNDICLCGARRAGHGLGWND